MKDLDIYNHFCELVLALIEADKEKLEEADKNAGYGILILHEKGASKGLAVERIIEQKGRDIDYVMIGDGDSDIIVSEYPVKLCAVGNASQLLKERAHETGGIVAKETYTQGVIEILMRL